MGSQFWQVSFRKVSPVFALALVLGAMPAKAQTYLQSVGVPSFATELPVENGFINAANGNLHLEIPLGSFPQRSGAPDKIVLMYDSAIWANPSGTAWTPKNIPNSQGSPYLNVWGGWRPVTSRESGYESYGTTYSGNCTKMADYYWETFSPWIWTAPDGSQHSFPASTTEPLYPGICGTAGSGTPNSTAYASDGSGFFMSITNYTNAVVYAPDGTKIGGAYAIEDSNGNYAPYINHTYNSTTNTDTWVYTDTVGRTILTETNNGRGNVYTFVVPNPQGTTSTYTMLTEQISVSTNFLQSGVTEFSGTITVPSEIDLPDGTKYTFGYENGPNGNYGLLASMTLPTGYKVGYSYQNFVDSLGNAYRPIFYRSSTDGKFDFAYASGSGGCVNGQMCEGNMRTTRPSGDQTQYTFFVNAGAWPIEIQYYTVRFPSGNTTLLATTTQCFSFTTVTNGTCVYNAPATGSTNIHLLGRTTTLPTPTGSVSATTAYSWDHNNVGTYGEMTKIQEWKFGNATTTPDRTTTIGYVSDTNSNYVTANNVPINILNRPTSVTISGGAQTLYAYDGGSLTSVTGMPGHDDGTYTTANTLRGNVTLVQQLVGSTYLNSSATYDTTGQALTSTDPNGAQTTLGYGCSNAYPTAIHEPVLPNPIQIGFDCNTGLLTSITDPNTQSTGFVYDSMSRPITTNYPGGGQTSITYNYNGSTYTGSTTTQKVTSSQNLVTTNNVDGPGRVTNSITTSDPDGQTTVNTVYDPNGRLYQVSNPFRTTSDPTYGFETNSGFDGLDRVTQITHADGHIASIYYGDQITTPGGLASQLCSTSSYGVGFPILKIDEANNKMQSWIDAFGKTIEVDEPTATSNTLTQNTCYKYDLNNNLIGVLAAGGLQTRSFAYDMVSRLTSETNPESETTTFVYDSDSMCGNGPYTSNGDLVRTTDAAGHCVMRYYDQLHRLTDVGNNNQAVSHCQRFRYDNSSGYPGSIKPSGLANTVGRLIEDTTDQCSTTDAIITDQWFGYDPMGRVTVNTQCTPANCGTSTSTLNYGYDLLGDMTSYTNGAGTTFTQGPFNGAGRLTSVMSAPSDANHPGTLLSNVHYNALGEPISATLGNGAVETLTYAPRGWPSTASVQSQSTGTPGTGTVTINGSEQSQTNPPVNTSAGPNGVGAGASQSGNGSAWTNPNNITLNNNYNAASAVGPYGVSGFSNYLLASSFGFNLPASTTSINGIQVQITKFQNAYVTGNVLDNSVLLRNGSGALVGTNHALSGIWVAGYNGATYTYGSSTDTWGASLSRSDFNGNFGVALSAKLLSARYHQVVAEVSYVTITVWYTYQNGPTYDSGSVSVTVNGSTAQPVQYANGNSTDTAVSIAGQLATNISALGFVTASTGGTNVITITSTTNGLGTNYSLSASSQSSAGFSPPSFTTSPSGANLTGGTGAPGTLYSFSLGYGAGNSNVTTANDNVNGSWAFTYDYLNRLSTANQNNTNACSFGYDQLGNRTSQTATAGSCGHLSLSYAGNNNRMDGYSYDAAGNLLGDGLHTYAYDAWNRLITVDGGSTASYVYDAEGRRVQKTGQVEYLYDLNGNIVTELTSTGGWNRGEVFANGQHLATYANSTTYFDHADWLGTERARSNMSDADCETITNLPFGDSQSPSGACADASPLHFTGQQRDAESGLHYFGARHYSTQFGRFMSPDPTGIFLGNLNDPQSLNLYSYVRGNPVNSTDPSGLQCDQFSSDCCDFCVPISIPVFFGGGGGGDWGPTGPLYIPPSVGTSPNPPNGSPASDDPFGGETFTNAGTDSPFNDPLSGLLPPGGLGCDLTGCDFRRQTHPRRLHPRSHLELFYPNIVTYLSIWKATNPKSWWAQHGLGYFCGSSPMQNTGDWTLEGAAKSGAIGAIAGGIVGGLPGALAGAGAGIDEGAAGGAIGGVAASKLCKDTGVYSK